MNIETANRLYELRKKNGLSQEELADKLGISRQAVSKWERAEASPDTDNLILLAKLYNVSLDELLNQEKAEDCAFENNEADKEAKEEFTENEKFHYSANGDSVHITDDGIHLKSEDDGDVFIKGKKVTVIKKDGTVEHKRWTFKSKNLASEILFTSLPILVTLVYLVLGFTTEYGWGVYWVLYLLIPVVPSFFEAIRKRRFCTFAYPVFVTMIYLFLGLRFKNFTYTIGNHEFTGFFHPMWILFLTIPVYYVIFGIVDKYNGTDEDEDEEYDKYSHLEDDVIDSK